MVADIPSEFRYSLFGLVIGLQTKDLPLVTENLLKVSYVATFGTAFCFVCLLLTS